MQRQFTCIVVGANEDPERKSHTRTEGGTRGTEETEAVTDILMLFFWLVTLYFLLCALESLYTIHLT